jgi:hypothetical protein
LRPGFSFDFGITDLLGCAPGVIDTMDQQPFSKRSICTILLGMMLLSFGCQGGQKVAGSTKAFPEKTGFVERQIKVDGQTKTVWVFLPDDYTPKRLYPAILFLHGLFEKRERQAATQMCWRPAWRR